MKSPFGRNVKFRATSTLSAVPAVPIPPPVPAVVWSVTSNPLTVEVPLVPRIDPPVVDSDTGEFVPPVTLATFKSVLELIEMLLGLVAVRLEALLTVVLMNVDVAVRFTAPVVVMVPPEMLVPDRATVPLPAAAVPTLTFPDTLVAETLPVVVKPLVVIDPGAFAVNVLPVTPPSVIEPTVFVAVTAPAPAFSARLLALIWPVAFKLIAPPLVAMEIVGGEATFWIVGAFSVTAPPAVVIPAARSRRFGVDAVSASGSGSAGVVYVPTVAVSDCAGAVSVIGSLMRM